MKSDGVTAAPDSTRSTYSRQILANSASTKAMTSTLRLTADTKGDAMRFRGASNAFRIGPNNLPIFTTAGGTQLPLPIGKVPTALHSDASFEDPSFTNWYLFWVTGTPTVTAETSNVLEADQAMSVALDSGEAQVVMSDTFTVAGGDFVEFGVWAAATVGAPKISLALLTRTGGTPDIFEPNSMVTESSSAVLSGGYAQQLFTAQVPAGDDTARIFFRVETTGGVAATVLLDLSFSAVTGSTASGTA